MYLFRPTSAACWTDCFNHRLHPPPSANVVFPRKFPTYLSCEMKTKSSDMFRIMDMVPLERLLYTQTTQNDNKENLLHSRWSNFSSVKRRVVLLFAHLNWIVSYNLLFSASFPVSGTKFEGRKKSVGLHRKRDHSAAWTLCFLLPCRLRRKERLHQRCVNEIVTFVR